MAHTGSEATSSCWADLQPELLTKIFAQSPLTSCLACECVCSVWKYALVNFFARETTGKALVLLHAKFSVASTCNSGALVAGLTILKHRYSLARWLSKRGAAFDAICFGTTTHPARLGKDIWEPLLSALSAESRSPQLQFAVPSMPVSLLCDPVTDFASRCLMSLRCSMTAGNLLVPWLQAWDRF